MTEDANATKAEPTPLPHWFEVIAGLLFLLGWGLRFFGDEGRFLDTRTAEDLKGEIVRPGEVLPPRKSPVTMAGHYLFGAAVAILLLCVVMRWLPRKRIAAGDDVKNPPT